MSDLTTIENPSLVVLIGAAGAGKSTLAQATWPGQVLSADHYREVITGDEGNQGCTREVFMVLHFLAESRVGRGLFTVIDATNKNGAERRPLLRMADKWEVPAVAVVVHPPLAVVLGRNASRRRQVPEDIITAQHRAVGDSLRLLRAEGFGRVIMVPAGGWEGRP